jgi:hypothetical protein
LHTRTFHSLVPTASTLALGVSALLFAGVVGCGGGDASTAQPPGTGAMGGTATGGSSGTATGGTGGSTGGTAGSNGGAGGSTGGSGAQGGTGTGGKGGKGGTSGTTGGAGGTTGGAGGTTGGAGGTTGGAGGTTGGAGGTTGGAGGTTGGAGGCGQPTPGATGVCQSYAPTTIADMRTALSPGCFELTSVGLVARTDSPSEPRIYVQDPGGAGLSAIMAKCAANASHLCSPAVRDKIGLLYDTFEAGAQVSLRGYFQYGSVGGFEEFYIEDVVDECTTVPRPAPIKLTVNDLKRTARKRESWFQRATVSIPAQDPLVPYDFSPPDLALTQPTCPDWAGFAVIPASSGADPATGCSGATQPAARASHPDEILIGRQFFNQFLYSGDCACSGQTNQRMIDPGNAVSGDAVGYLILEQDQGSTATYQVFEAAADQTFQLR